MTEKTETVGPSSASSSESMNHDQAAAMRDQVRPGLLELGGNVPLRLLLLCALFAYPALMVMQTSLDNDIWWHLRTGQWVIQHTTVPHTDPFSSFGQGKPWLAYSWLFEVLVYGLYVGLGLGGIVLYRVVMVFLVAVAIDRFVAKRESRFLPAIVLVGLSFLALARLMSERPWLFTILFSLFTLDLVLDLRAGKDRRDLWLLPVVYALWANIHIQFVYGLGLLVLACVAPCIDRLPWFTSPGGDAARAGPPSWYRLVAVTMACFLATLINPYHVHIYTVVKEYAFQSAVNDHINEFLAMPFRFVDDWGLLALTLLAVFVLGRRRTFSSFDLILLVGAIILSFRACRDGWVMVFAALTILTRNEDGARDRLPARVSMKALEALTVGMSTITLLFVLKWACNVNESGLRQAEAFIYPAHAVAFIERKGYGGPIYNNFNWGGYLIWKLPRLPVCVDGRTNLHGDQRLVRLFRSWSGKAGWRVPELEAARLVIGPADDPLMSLLCKDDRFERVYVDLQAMVFIAHDDVAANDRGQRGRH